MAKRCPWSCGEAAVSSYTPLNHCCIPFWKHFSLAPRTSEKRNPKIYLAREADRFCGYMVKWKRGKCWLCFLPFYTAPTYSSKKETGLYIGCWVRAHTATVGRHLKFARLSFLSWCHDWVFSKSFSYCLRPAASGDAGHAKLGKFFELHLIVSLSLL